MVSVDSKIAPIKTLEWNGDSLIKKVELREQGKGHMVAYIHAADHGVEDYPKLFTLHEEFKRKGWAASSDNHHGKAVLRVTGIESEQQLTDLLKASNATQGNARMSQQDVAGQGSKGIVDFVKSNSLRVSGLFYLLGDSLFIQSGRARGNDIAQMGTGISFAAGDAALMVFGGKDDKRQFKALLTKLRKHLEKEGVEIPTGAAINAETMAKPGGFLEKTYDFIHENINSFKIIAEVVGGSFMVYAGLDKKQNNKSKAAAGAFIVAGWGASLLIKEKKRDPEKWEQASPLEKAAMYIQEKPLMLAGGSGLINNALVTVGALKERAKERANGAAGTDHYKWDMLGTAAMVTANSLYSICSKSTGGNIKADALVNDVYGLAAQIVNRQPDAVKDAVINSTVEFLGARPEIKDTKQQIAKRLRNEIEMQSQNPWFRATHDEKETSHVAAVGRSRSNAESTQPSRA